MSNKVLHIENGYGIFKCFFLCFKWFRNFIMGLKFFGCWDFLWFTRIQFFSRVGSSFRDETKIENKKFKSQKNWPLFILAVEAFLSDSTSFSVLSSVWPVKSKFGGGINWRPSGNRLLLTSARDGLKKLHWKTEIWSNWGNRLWNLVAIVGECFELFTQRHSIVASTIWAD